MSIGAGVRWDEHAQSFGQRLLALGVTDGVLYRKAAGIDRRLFKVGAGGFEPPTPCTPCKCASGLRYAPNGVDYSARTGD